MEDHIEIPADNTGIVADNVPESQSEHELDLELNHESLEEVTEAEETTEDIAPMEDYEVDTLRNDLIENVEGGSELVTALENHTLTAEQADVNRGVKLGSFS